jgi:hypothetical protein
MTLLNGDGLAVAAEQAVAVAGEVVAARAFLGFRGVGGVALEHRRGEGIFALVVMIGGERVGGGGGPLALGVAVEQVLKQRLPSSIWPD